MQLNFLFHLLCNSLFIPLCLLHFNCIDSNILSQQETQYPIATYYNTVEELKKSNISLNSYVATTGFYESNDGGGAIYHITKETSSYSTPTSIQLENGLTAQFQAVNSTASAKQFGTFGNGINDDTFALQVAINSGYSTIDLPTGTYKITDSLYFNTSNLIIDGNNSVLYVDNSFEGTKEWILNLRANSIQIKNLTITSNETIPLAYKSQLSIISCKDITLTNCHFIVPSTVPVTNNNGQKKEYTNIDLYSDWHDITIENCEFKLLSDSNSGGCIWIRDLLKTGCSNLNFRNNTCEKIGHDEILGIYLGTISDIQITDNIFNISSNLATPPNVCFTIGSNEEDSIQNIIFSGNQINAVSACVLANVNNVSNLTFEKNQIAFKRIPSTNNGYLFYSNNNNQNISISYNYITISSTDDTSLYCFADIQASFYCNIVSSSLPISNTFFENKCISIEKNSILLKKGASMLTNGIYSIANNTILSYGKLPIFFQYYNLTLSKPIKINDNSIYYLFEEDDNALGHLFMLNNISFQNFALTFDNNTIIAPYTNPGNRLYMLVSSDSTPAKITISNNLLQGYQKTYENCATTPNLSFNNNVVQPLQQ